MEPKLKQKTKIMKNLYVNIITMVYDMFCDEVYEMILVKLI